MRNRYIQYAILSLCTCGLIGCQLKPTEKEQERIFPVDIQYIDTVSCVHTHTYIGNIEESSSLQLSFPTGGRLTQICVQNNHFVQEGQLLAQVDATQETSMLQAAQAKLLQAKDGYARAEQVYRDGGLTELKWVEIGTNLKEAQSSVIALEKRVKDCNLYAPSSGVVSSIQSRVGENVAPNQVILTLLNISGMNVSFTVAEKDVSSICLGDTAILTVSALGDMEMRGIVTEKKLTAEPLSHAYVVKSRILLPDSLRHVLLPGMVAKVRLTTQATKGYMLPAHCVQLMADGTMVWVVQDGKVQRRMVSNCIFINEFVMIQDGLNRGDSVVISGQHKLFSGARVQIKEKR